MNGIKNRVALVTAGSRGLGAEIVRQLAAAGAHVAFTYLRDAAAGKRVQGQVRKMGRKCLALQADAANYRRAGAVVSEVNRKLGPIDILVCNAGMARGTPLRNMTEADWDEVIGLTLKGSFNYLRASTPGFIERQGGKVVMVGSINGLRGRMGTISYNTAKAGLTGMVKTAASELGRYNVNVNLVAPGFIETPSQERTPELIRDLVLKECAIKRLGEPKDIAPVVVFLCSEAARHITGQSIKVDAGQYL